MTYRYRTMTDDVLEAIQRGIDPDVIRELGVLYDALEEKYWEGIHGDYGWDHATIRKIADTLKLSPHDIRDGYDMAMECFKCIRYRLTGHRKTRIKVTQQDQRPTET